MAIQTGSSFPTTNWSEIGQLESPEFSKVMARLCQRYWYPIYVFVRRRCDDQHRAEDLTQAFFVHVLSKQTFRAADPSKGRFRSFLLTAVRNFIANENAAQRTIRRGGDVQTVSIDFQAAEEIYCRHYQGRAAECRPEDDFDRAWATTLMERAIERLRDDFRAKDQLKRFECLSPILQSSELDYSAIAEELEIDAVAVRKAASRFRRQYGQMLRAEISATLSESGDLDEEVSWMMRLFSN